MPNMRPLYRNPAEDDSAMVYRAQRRTRPPFGTLSTNEDDSAMLFASKRPATFGRASSRRTTVTIGTAISIGSTPPTSGVSPLRPSCGDAANQGDRTRSALSRQMRSRLPQGERVAPAYRLLLHPRHRRSTAPRVRPCTKHGRRGASRARSRAGSRSRRPYRRNSGRRKQDRFSSHAPFVFFVFFHSRLRLHLCATPPPCAAPPYASRRGACSASENTLCPRLDPRPFARAALDRQARPPAADPTARRHASIDLDRRSRCVDEGDVDRKAHAERMHVAARNKHRTGGFRLERFALQACKALHEPCQNPRFSSARLPADPFFFRAPSFACALIRPYLHRASLLASVFPCDRRNRVSYAPRAPITAPRLSCRGLS